jgi:hypothetical protein
MFQSLKEMQRSNVTINTDFALPPRCCYILTNKNYGKKLHIFRRPITTYDFKTLYKKIRRDKRRQWHTRLI